MESLEGHGFNCSDSYLTLPPSEGAGRKDSELNFVRSVPKFLQGHIHLLGRKGAANEEEPEAENVIAEDQGGPLQRDDEQVSL